MGIMPHRHGLGRRRSFFFRYGGEFCSGYVLEERRHEGAALGAVPGDDMGDVLRVEDEAEELHLPRAGSGKTSADMPWAGEIHHAPVFGHTKRAACHGDAGLRAMPEGGA